VLGDTDYLSAASRAGDLVWRQGLLKKGPGLCHGVTGNAYALLKLWKVTQVCVVAGLEAFTAAVTAGDGLRGPTGGSAIGGPPIGGLGGPVGGLGGPVGGLGGPVGGQWWTSGFL